ncbi:MAG: hypothetical protein ABI442_10025 [Gemmatimonadaceae bacterium]
MELFHTTIEAHSMGATLYITGFLTDAAATQTAELMAGLPADTRVIRVDLRGVELIDPTAFVTIARTLSGWRDARRGRVTIEFPERAKRRKEDRLRLMDQPITTGMAVSTAMS